MCIFSYSNVSPMAKEMDIMREIKQKWAKQNHEASIFKLFILIPHLRIYKLPAAVCIQWFLETPQAAGNVLSEIRCFRGRFASHFSETSMSREDLCNFYSFGREDVFA